MNILEQIKNNKNYLENTQRQQAYSGALQENKLLPLIALSEMQNNPMSLMQNAIPNNQVNAPLPQISPLQNIQQSLVPQPQNMQNPQAPEHGSKINDIVGKILNFADSPLGRGLITGGVVGFDSGSLGQGLTYGLGAAAQNQGVRNADTLYRQKLLDAGYTQEQMDGLPGYVTDDTFKNVYTSDLNRLKYENNLLYRQNMIGIRQQDQDFKESKNFITYGEFDKYRLDNGLITPEEYDLRISNPMYNPKDTINLNAVDTISKSSVNSAKVEKSNDDIKTEKQKRYYRSKNDGKNVMKVEYGNKPDSASHTYVHYGEKPVTKNETRIIYENKPQYGYKPNSPKKSTPQQPKNTNPQNQKEGKSNFVKQMIEALILKKNNGENVF